MIRGVIRGYESLKSDFQPLHQEVHAKKIQTHLFNSDFLVVFYPSDSLLHHIKALILLPVAPAHICPHLRKGLSMTPPYSACKSALGFGFPSDAVPSSLKTPAP